MSIDPPDLRGDGHGAQSEPNRIEITEFDDAVVLKRLRAWAHHSKGVPNESFDEAEVSARAVELEISVARTTQTVSASRRTAHERPADPTFVSESELTRPVSSPPRDQTWTFVKAGSVFTQECATCNVTGCVTCRDCGGRAEVQCDKCAGRGGRPCSPTETCRTCDGKGTLSTWTDPGSFTDYSMNRQVACTTCHGSRKVPCRKCGGSSWEVCSRCRERGLVSCGCRNGEVKCPSCNGNPITYSWDEYVVKHTVSIRRFARSPISSDAGRMCPEGEPARDSWAGDNTACGYDLPDDLVSEAGGELERWDAGNVDVRGAIELLPVARVLWGAADRRRTAYVCGTDLAVKAPKARRATVWLRDVREQTPPWKFGVATIAAFVLLAAGLVYVPVLTSESESVSTNDPPERERPLHSSARPFYAGQWSGRLFFGNEGEPLVRARLRLDVESRRLQGRLGYPPDCYQVLRETAFTRGTSVRMSQTGRRGCADGRMAIRPRDDSTIMVRIRSGNGDSYRGVLRRRSR